jgi:exoribonuclease-2
MKELELQMLSSQIAELGARLRNGEAAVVADYPKLTEVLQRFASGGSCPSDALVAMLLDNNRMAKSPRHAAGHMLIRLGLWDGHDDLDLMQSGLLNDWPEQVETHLESGPTVPDDVPFLDLPWVSIDGPDASEVDDAVFAQRQGSSIVLWVAIASPSCWFARDGDVDRIAEKRAATLYHPRYRAPMLPTRLAQDLASLRPGQRRPALVVKTKIDKNGAIDPMSLSEAWIQVDKAWSYDGLGAALEGRQEPGCSIDVELAELLAEAARRSEAKRVEDGAWLLYRPEVEVQAPRHGEIRLFEAHQGTLARRVVGEAMVIHGMAVGALCAQRAITVPFRSQRPPKRPTLQPGLYTEPADIYGMLRHMAPARFDTRPGSHAVLAATSYVQCSSPLRRYGDLLTQRQIIAALRNQAAPRSKSSIQRTMGRYAQAIRRYRTIDRKARRYFCLLWLAHRGLGTRLRAQLIDDPARKGRTLAFAVEVALEIELQRYSGPVGQWVDLEIEAIDPVRDHIETIVHPTPG